MIKKVLIDCDPGMDDSMAIVMACKSQNLEVVGITAVNGNYPLDVTEKNARKTLEMIGRKDIPVSKGMKKPIIREIPKDPFSHGADGQAEAFLPEPTMPISDIHAVDLIIETVRKYPGEVYIAALAPLSNIAMAMIKDPEIIGMIPGIVAISGAFGLNEYSYLNATGDSPQSEWNVFVDPEAAKTVYESGVNLIAIGLDIATHFGVDFDENDLDKLSRSENKEAWFLNNAIKFVRNRGFDAYCTVIDCMAIGYLIDPTLIKTRVAKVGVETKDGLTLGMTVRDDRHHHVWEHLPEINIGIDADYERFLKLIIDLVLK